MWKKFISMFSLMTCESHYYVVSKLNDEFNREKIKLEGIRLSLYEELTNIKSDHNIFFNDNKKLNAMLSAAHDEIRNLKELENKTIAELNSDNETLRQNNKQLNNSVQVSISKNNDLKIEFTALMVDLKNVSAELVEFKKGWDIQHKEYCDLQTILINERKKHNALESIFSELAEIACNQTILIDELKNGKSGVLENVFQFMGVKIL